LEPEHILTQSNYENLLSLTTSSNERKIISELSQFGRAPKNFPFNTFLMFLYHKNPKIRLYCVKHLGKFSDPIITQKLEKRFELEVNTLVRREIISSIGRQRKSKNIPILISFLKDDDPKVVLQAIRGLLYFKNESLVKKRLSELQNHVNETISQVLKAELAEKKTQKKSQSKSQKNKFTNLIIQGDIRNVLKHVPDETIDLTFTSPPYYNARDYTIYKSYEEYLSFLEDVFKEVHRVTAEGRFFLLNTSPVIQPRVSRAHSSKRYAIPFDMHPRLLKLGFDFIDDIIWAKPAPSAKNRNGGFYQHRKPLGYKPNVIVEYVMVYRKHTDKLIDWNMKQCPPDVMEKSKVKGDYEMTNLWQIAPSTSKSHPASFPKKLVENVVKFYSYENDLVFDTFAGNGTVGTVCKKLNRNYFLVDNNKDYVKFMGENIGKTYSLPEFLNKK